MRQQNPFLERHKEFILYTVVGVGMTLFNWAAYSLFVEFLPMFVANAFSWAATTFVTFLLNKLYVFHSRSFERNIVIKEFISFFTARGVTGALEVVLQPELYALGMNRPLFGVEGLEAKITVCIILSLVNYVSTKLFVFRTDVKRAESM